MRRNMVAIPIWAVCLTAPHHVPSLQSVELAVLHPAAIVRIQGDEYLVHELWITNRFPLAATLDSVSVLDGTTVRAHYEGR